MNVPPDLTWPLHFQREAPYTGDETLEPLLEWARSKDKGKRSLSAIYARVLRGDLPALDPRVGITLSDLDILPEGALAPWGMAPPPFPLGAPPLPFLEASPQVPFDQWFADESESRVPEMGFYGAERVLGPWADEHPDPTTRMVACGALAFSASLFPNARPLDRICHDRAHTPFLERAMARAVEQSPPMLWQVKGSTWRPLLPFPARFLPYQPVLLAPRHEGDDLGDPTDGQWLARLVPSLSEKAGAFACLALRLPLPVPPRPLVARLILEWARERLGNPKLQWIPFLRSRGEVLYRCAHEMAWLEAQR